jgi:hypothetical protein
MKFNVYFLFNFQYYPKVIIMLNNLVLPLVGVWTLLKLNNINSIEECMDIKCGLIDWNAQKHVLFIWNKCWNLRLSKFAIMICKSRFSIIIIDSSFKTLIMFCLISH